MMNDLKQLSEKIIAKISTAQRNNQDGTPSATQQHSLVTELLAQHLADLGFVNRAEFEAQERVLARTSLLVTALETRVALLEQELATQHSAQPLERAPDIQSKTP